MSGWSVIELSTTSDGIHNRMKSILVVTLSNFGDVIMTTPVIMALAARYPEARLTVVVGYKACSVLEKSSHIDRVVPYDKRMNLLSKWRFIRELRKKPYDCIVDLRNSPIPLLIPCKIRSPLFRRFRTINMRDRHQEILEMMGVRIRFPPPFEFFDAADRRSALEKLRDKGIASTGGWIVVAPGAASEKKRWPVECFQEVIRQLVAGTARKVLLVGAGNERPIAEAVVRGAPGIATILSGETTMPETAVLLSSAVLVVANDSAVMHLGFELGVPTVGIFGPTDHEKYGHAGPRFRVAREDAGACSCGSEKLPYAERHCFHGLGPEKVLRLCAELLPGSGAPEARRGKGEGEGF